MVDNPLICYLRSSTTQLEEGLQLKVPSLRALIT